MGTSIIQTVLHASVSDSQAMSSAHLGCSEAFRDESYLENSLTAAARVPK